MIPKRILPSCVLAFGLCCTMIGVAPGQIPDYPMKQTAEVTGDNVHVRSGPSLNHYPVLKLGAGDRVTVVGEEGDWYKILPPSEAFSLISGDYVDTADGEHGVVNGNNVRVRAGSSLSEHKYTVQTMLSKGAEVTILGRNPDGFLRISPPEGATLWVSRQFIELVPDELIQLEKETARAMTERPTSESPGTEGAQPGRSPKEAVKDAEAKAETETRSALAKLPATGARRTLEVLDGEARQEMKKPLLERQFDSLIERYQAVASQDTEDDSLVRQYASRRVEQLTYMKDLIESVRRVRRLSEQAESTRREKMDERASLKTVEPSKPAGFDVKGELRYSSIYRSPAGPQRLRLIDPRSSSPRTIGYVELTGELKDKAEEFVGQYVGVRASDKRLQVGGVNPVPIYVAAEIVLLTPPETEATGTPSEE
ncbi:MAG: SH3 domain-containing protein [Phycisphaerales bacterium]|nr:MAG: SH3 domain-containing protein [Phycisphaerales bacterium]